MANTESKNIKLVNLNSNYWEKSLKEIETKEKDPIIKADIAELIAKTKMQIAHDPNMPAYFAATPDVVYSTNIERIFSIEIGEDVYICSRSDESYDIITAFAEAIVINEVQIETDISQAITTDKFFLISAIVKVYPMNITNNIRATARNFQDNIRIIISFNKKEMDAVIAKSKTINKDILTNYDSNMKMAIKHLFPAMTMEAVAIPK